MIIKMVLKNETFLTNITDSLLIQKQNNCLFNLAVILCPFSGIPMEIKQKYRKGKPE